MSAREITATFNPLKFRLKRLARRFVWARPTIYAPIALLRRRTNVLRFDHQLYIDGFPRSGNSFAVKAFQCANPDLSVRSHKHIPTFIIQSARLNKPGMVPLRYPIDAAISWAIFTGGSLRDTLAYYNDYHSVLLKHHEPLFFVSFESIKGDFGKVMSDFNTRWGTNYVPFQHTLANVARCMAQIEADYTNADGEVAELKVPRPSVHRQPLRQKLLQQLNHSRATQEELGRANELYQNLAKNFTARPQLKMTKTTRSIRLRPAM